MLIHLNRENFLKSIIIADSIISSKSVNTILSNCLFNVLKDEIEIISSDKEIAIKTTIEAVSDSVYSFTANGKKLAAIIKELPDNELVLDVNNEYLIDIKTNNIKGHYSLIGNSPDEFPIMPQVNYQDYFELDQSLLKEILKKVIYAASVDTIKPVFNGIFFQTDSNKIIAVATDSRRLSVISRTANFIDSIKDGIIIPLKTISEIFRLLENTGKCKFSYNNNQCFFKIGHTEIISRIINGQFPNYKQVIPKEHSKIATIETKKLLNCAKRAMIFTREPSNRIVLNFKSNTLVIEANTPEYGISEEEIQIETNNQDQISIGLNVQFLIDTLKEIDSFSIKCSITGQMSPLTITPDDDDNYVSVIMPIQIKSNTTD